MEKERRRYLLVRVLSNEKVSEKDFTSALTMVAQNLFGSVGLLQISPRIVRYDCLRSEAILKCREESVERLRSVVAVLTQVAGHQAAAFVIHSSGTIRALRRLHATEDL